MFAVAIWGSFKIWNAGRDIHVSPPDATFDDDSFPGSDESSAAECRGETVVDDDEIFEENDCSIYDLDDSSLAADPGLHSSNAVVG